MSKYWRHFKVIAKHKWVVMKLLFRLGLWKQALLHDNSKFLPSEFFVSARFFTGTVSPASKEKEAYGYSLSWQHHQNHNPHHWEYWIDSNSDSYDKDPVMYPVQMPLKYVLEMVCDWIAAGQVYEKEKWSQDAPYNFYLKKNGRLLIHDRTWALVHCLVELIRFKGIDGFINGWKDITMVPTYDDTPSENRAGIAMYNHCIGKIEKTFTKYVGGN